MNVFGTTHAGFIIFFTILCFIAILLISLLLAKKISNKILLIEIFVIALLCVKLGCSAALDMVFNNSSNNIGKAIHDNYPDAEITDFDKENSYGVFNCEDKIYHYYVKKNMLVINDCGKEIYISGDKY